MSAKNNGFTFKQFHINHDRCAMKVGTDGIILGSRADIRSASSILDLGTGCGLVALMLAQRTHSDVRISAVEIEDEAFLQAQENIANSPWPEKIKLYQQDIADFSKNTTHAFDLIVANPPYFAQGVECHSEARNIARYTYGKSHADWLQIAAQCVSKQGKIQFILPFEAGKILLKSTALYCIDYCEIITKIGKSPQRLLLTFSPLEKNRTESQIVIYDENNHYHQDFMTLTKDFYFKF